ncbi:AbrB/MazE/SpoVT family DNA-binding domain-containing protein [bacterium]|nr:AbrB/MazE/SpoVT family DNA-binding domain-containing protein [bacterium]
MELSRITTKGQITLPSSIRKRFGLGTGQQVMFEATEAGILVKPVRIQDLTRESKWKKELRIALKQVETGQGTFYGSTEEFMKALETDFGKTPRKKSRRINK